MRGVRPLLSAASAAWLLVSSASVHAQDNLAAAIAELRAQNAELAARIAELERERGGSRQAPTPVTAATVKAATVTAKGEQSSAPADPALASGSARSTQLADRTADVGRPVPTRDFTVQVPPGPLDRPVQGGGVGLQLNASSAGGQVSVSFGQSVRKTKVAYDQVKASGMTWNVTASAPVDKKGGDSALATLDSFTDSSTLKVGIAKLFLTLPNLLTDTERNQIEEKAIAACAAAAKDDAGKVICLESGIDEDFIATWLPHEVRRYAEINSAQRSGWGLGLEGTIGYRRYSYLDTTAFTTAEADKVPWGVKVFATWLPRTDLAVTASAAYQRGYEERSSTILCPAVATGPTLTCLTGANGLPDRKNKVLLALDGRKLFDLSLTRFQNGVVDRFGIAPQVTWDVKNKDFGIDVPVYLVPDDKGNLIGGFRLGYTNGDKGFIAGVFVGAAFDQFKR